MRRTTLNVYLPKHITDLYHDEHGVLDQILPYPLWRKRPEWTRKKKIEGICPIDNLFTGTYASCPSTKNWCNKSIVIPWPADFSIGKVGDEIRFKYVPENFIGIQQHTREQLPPWENRAHIKFILPYNISSKGPMLFVDPHLHKESVRQPFIIVPGLVKSDLRVGLNVNTLWGELKEGEFHDFLAGSPMCYLTFPSAKGNVDVKIIHSDAEKWPRWWKTAMRGFLIR